MEFTGKLLHAINCNNGEPFNFETSINILDSILDKKALLSNNKRDSKLKNNGWNGMDHISLCDYDAINNPPYDNNPYYQDYTAFDAYISSSLSLVLDKVNLDII